MLKVQILINERAKVDQALLLKNILSLADHLSTLKVSQSNQDLVVKRRNRLYAKAQRTHKKDQKNKVN